MTNRKQGEHCQASARSKPLQQQIVTHRILRHRVKFLVVGFFFLRKGFFTANCRALFFPACGQEKLTC